MTHEIRNTREAIDEEQPAREMPDYDADGFWPPQPRIDLIEESLRLLRRVRDRTQYVPHNRALASLVAQLEDHQALLRTERHR